MTNKHTILVLEDERVLLNAIKTALEIAGFNIVSAVSVSQALELMSKYKIDCIWLDHYLFGKESGLDFLNKLKTPDSSYKSIPIFVVSNTTDPQKAATYIRLGAQKYYVKSDHRLDQIVEEIINYLKDPHD